MDVNTIQTSLTPKQKEVLIFIEKFIVKNNYSPSLNEIAKGLNKAVSTVQHFIEELKRKGYLNQKENISRGINPTNENGLTKLFKLGYIAAGNPIDPIENPELISVPSSLVSSQGNHYALEVKGESMIEEGILNGDIIIIKHQQTANNGDIVVAITENGATLKIFRQKNGILYLEPRNKKLSNIYPKQLTIRGKLIGLVRKN